MSATTTTTTTTKSYTVRYCYTFERGFEDAFSVTDVVLYETDGDSTSEIVEYLMAEEESEKGEEEEEEEEQHIFFMNREFQLPQANEHNFVMVALYPSVADEGSVVNVLFYPVADNTMSQEAQSEVLKVVVGEAEADQGFSYTVVYTMPFCLTVANAPEEEEEEAEEEAEEES